MIAAARQRAFDAAAAEAEARGLDITTADLAALLDAAAPHLDGRRHGDHAGYNAHRYRGEDPCEACAAGERAYRNDLAAKRRANTAPKETA